MHQDSFRSVVCRSLSKSLPSGRKDGGSSYPEPVQCVLPCVVTLQPSVCQSCQPSWSQSYREERSMSLHRDYPSLSKHFAEDLLRGAMDLRESLAMLDGFQAASQSMRQSNKKRRPEPAEKSTDIDTIIRETLLRSSNASKKVLPRTVSNDRLYGQLSTHTDELKSLVKDSLHKNKNLLSASKTTHTQQKKVATKSQTDKSTPSLVAKLMGLDGLPSQNDHSVIKDEKTKPVVSSPRAFFDTEMPKSKRLLPQLPAEDSRSSTEMHVSEMLPPDHYTAGMNYNRSQKIISPLCDTPMVNETGSMKQVHREKSMEQVRAKSPKEIKVISPTSRKQQTKEPTEISRRTREKQKSHLLTERNREGRKDVKPKAGSASHAKIMQKPDKKLAASSSRGSVKPVLRKAPSNSRQKTVTRRNVKSPTVDEIVAYQSQTETVLDESDGPSTEHSATPSDESIRGADWDAESSVDDVRSDLISEFVNESSVSSSSQCESIISSAYTDRQPSAVMIPTKAEVEITDEISLLLLSDTWFLGRAVEVTGITGSYDHLTNRYKGAAIPEMKNCELYLDIAAEQLDRKLGCWHSAGFLGARRRASTPCYYSSLEALLTDISNGIRKLSSTYTGGSTDDDSLRMKLERDLWHRKTDAWIDGVWDMGWEDWVSMEETECFVRDAGEHILSLLMEEAVLDLNDTSVTLY